jgi:hypothetical protein
MDCVSNASTKSTSEYFFSHNFFTMSRNIYLLEEILSYLNIAEKMKTLIINKKFSKLVSKEIKAIKPIKNTFLQSLHIFLSKFPINKIANFNLDSSVVNDQNNKEIIDVLLPFYFYKYYGGKINYINLCNNNNNNFYNNCNGGLKNISSTTTNNIGSNLIAFIYERIQLKKLKITENTPINSLLNSYYFKNNAYLEKLQIEKSVFDKLILNMRNLKELKLKACKINDNLLETIINCILINKIQLQKLNIKKNEIWGGSLISLLKECKSLKSLNCDFNYIYGNRLIELTRYIDHESKLEKISLRDNKIDDNTSKTFFSNLINNFPNCLKIISLSNNDISNNAIKEIGSLLINNHNKCNLQKIYLRNIKCSESQFMKLVNKLNEQNKLKRLHLISKNIKKVNNSNNSNNNNNLEAKVNIII